MSWIKEVWKKLTAQPSVGPTASLHSCFEITSKTRRMEAIEAMSNFTPRAQQVLALARLEASQLNHNFIGTEHLLLGLIKLGHGCAVNVLESMGLNLETVRMEVEKQVGIGPDQKMLPHIPYTPRARRVLALAAKEAKELNHSYVGTEHLLLGLLRDEDGVAARVLKIMDVDIEQTRREVLRALDPNYDPAAAVRTIESSTSSPKPGTRLGATSQQSSCEDIDVSKRYDIYCTDWREGMVVYRNARFSGARHLYSKPQKDAVSEYIEIEKSDGQIIFVSRFSIFKFCQHGATPGGENAAGSFGTNLLDACRELAAIAQTGLHFSTDSYDQERYRRINEIAAALLADGSDVSAETILNWSKAEFGYATPKVDVRAFILKDERVLLIREDADGGRWTLPGGWADVNESPSESVVREVREECGFEIRPVRLLAVFDREKQGHVPPFPYHVYKLFFQCEIIGGEAKRTAESSESGFFSEDELPELSISRVLPQQLQGFFTAARSGDSKAKFD